MPSRIAAALSMMLLAVSASAATTQTQVVVRVVAHDGKILGTDAGGAEVRIYNAATHALLASGIQNGDSGNLDQIMKKEHYRSDVAKFASPKAASFTTMLGLSRPTKVEIVAEGPLAFPATKQRVSKTVTLLPGASMDPANEDGIVIDLYGFAMKFDSVVPASKALKVTTHVAMMCGCKIDEDSPWPPSRFTVMASLRQHATAVAETRMEWTASSTYTAGFTGIKPGQYELLVTASDDQRGNFSSIRQLITIAP